MISQAPQLTLDGPLTRVSSSTLQHRVVFALLSLVVFGGWATAWMLILGFGLKFAIVMLAGLVFYSMVPAPSARSQVAVRSTSTPTWSARPNVAVRHARIR